MIASLGHIQINVHPDNMAFYIELVEFLGWNKLYMDENVAGYIGDNNASLWFMATPGKDANDFDNVGVNHIGLNVTEQEDVDSVVSYLEAKGVESLFDTPRHRADFAESDTETYYQVMFRSPDNVLFEVVYTGEKKQKA